jgi:hypothetical protein
MTARTAAKIGIGLVTALLLTGMGEAIFSAPALVPALWWAARSSNVWARAVLTFLAALVMTEVGWFLAYSASGEDQPLIILAPALGFAVTVFAFTFVPRATKTAGRAQGRSGPRARG